MSILEKINTNANTRRRLDFTRLRYIQERHAEDVAVLSWSSRSNKCDKEFMYEAELLLMLRVKVGNTYLNFGLIVIDMQNGFVSRGGSYDKLGMRGILELMNRCTEYQ